MTTLTLLLVLLGGLAPSQIPGGGRKPPASADALCPVHCGKGSVGH